MDHPSSATLKRSIPILNHKGSQVLQGWLHPSSVATPLGRAWTVFLWTRTTRLGSTHTALALVLAGCHRNATVGLPRPQLRDTRSGHKEKEEREGIIQTYFLWSHNFNFLCGFILFLIHYSISCFVYILLYAAWGAILVLEKFKYEL